MDRARVFLNSAAADEERAAPAIDTETPAANATGSAPDVVLFGSSLIGAHSKVKVVDTWKPTDISTIDVVVASVIPWGLQPRRSKNPNVGWMERFSLWRSGVSQL